MNTFIGTIVKVSAGRDVDGYFVVVGCDDDGFLYIADGKNRKLEKPKKKNVKHLQFTKTTIDLKEFTNKDLRKFLNQYNLRNLLSGGNANV